MAVLSAESFQGHHVVVRTILHHRNMKGECYENTHDNFDRYLWLAELALAGIESRSAGDGG